MNIEKLTYSEVEGIEGSAGNFKVRIRKKARYIHEDKCTGCGECMENCLVRNKILIEPPVIPEVEIDDDRDALVTGILEQYAGAEESLVPILQDINAELNWLPPEVLMLVSMRKQIPLGKILAIATFYKSFSLVPRGKHIITVCLGTACHVKGAGRILDRLAERLGIKVGETTPDMMFTLEGVRCIGCCGLAPVLTIGKDVHGKLNAATAAALLDHYR
jgi:NADH-quinone oxidoreductase subunit E